MRLAQALRGYRPGWRHNPDHFYPNSFEVGEEGGRLVLYGRAKRHIGKNFHIVAILKPLGTKHNGIR